MQSLAPSQNGGTSTNQLGAHWHVEDSNNQRLCIDPDTKRPGVFMKISDQDTIAGSSENQAKQNFSAMFSDGRQDFLYAGDMRWMPQSMPITESYTGTACSGKDLSYKYVVSAAAFDDSVEENAEEDPSEIMKKLVTALGKNTVIPAWGTFRGWEARDDVFEGDFPHDGRFILLDMRPEVQGTGSHSLTTRSLASWMMKLDSDWLNTQGIDPELKDQASKLEMSAAGRVDWNIVLDQQATATCPT